MSESAEQAQLSINGALGPPFGQQVGLVPNSSRLVASAASIISPRSGATEHNRRERSQVKGRRAPWGWSPASDSGLSSQAPAYRCSVFVCLDNSPSVGYSPRGAAVCRWLKLFPV